MCLIMLGPIMKVTEIIMPDSSYILHDNVQQILDNVHLVRS